MQEKQESQAKAQPKAKAPGRTRTRATRQQWIAPFAALDEQGGGRIRAKAMRQR